MFYHMGDLQGAGVKTLKNCITLTLCLCLQKGAKRLYNLDTFVDERL